LLNEEDDIRSGMRIAGGMSVGLLVQGAYDVLATMSSGRHLSAGELRRAVEALGRPIVETPDSEWSHIALSPSTGEGPAGFDFVVPLWTSDGRSGLGLAAHLIPTTYGTFDLEIKGFVPIEAGAVPDTPGREAPAARAGDTAGGSDRRSDSPVPKRWRTLLESIVHRLVIGDYAGLAADGLVSYTNDPTDESIGRWIEDYPAKLVDLPAEAWAYSAHAPWAGAAQSWWVIVPLWTAEEGHSDLSMEATIWDDGFEIVAKIDNVHVM
jgi:hypothetical protein